jgi:preprotein translocase subunit SecE
MAKGKKDKNKKNENTVGYFAGVKRELSKVVWPTRKELISYTVVVVVTCFVFAMGFWLMDLGILEALKQILGITLS